MADEGQPKTRGNRKLHCNYNWSPAVGTSCVSSGTAHLLEIQIKSRNYLCFGLVCICYVYVFVYVCLLFVYVAEYRTVVFQSTVREAGATQ